MENWKSQIIGEAKEIQEQLVEWRRTLHRHPEVGFELTFTKVFVKEKLEEMGCEPVDCGKCGLTVLLGKPGKKTILLRGDMDALPVQEMADVPYASENAGYMHGCGHALHTAMLLGAAKVLKNVPASGGDFWRGSRHDRSWCSGKSPCGWSYDHPCDHRYSDASRFLYDSRGWNRNFIQR